jgi:tetratricopeptide (TPR) repeat protein
MASGSIAAYGDGLLALDRNDAAAAEKALEVAPDARTPALTLALLQAQDQAGDDAAAQATRSAMTPQCKAPQTPIERDACAEALAGGEGDAAARALQQAHTAFPHDDTITLAAADALSDAGNDKAAAVLLRELLKSDDQNARAWYLLGRSAIKLGDAQPAVDDYLVHALVLDTRATNEAALGDTLNALGVGYERLGQLEAAAEQYTRAAALREKRGDEAGLAKSLRNLAIVQAERGERTAADKALDRVRTLLEKRGDRASLADLYNDRGVVAEERGDFAAALADYRQALAMRQQLDEPALVAESLNNVGYAAYQMGDFDNAGAYLQQALAQFQKLDDRTRALHVGQSMALLDIARGHFAAARTRLEQSLRESEDHQLPEESAVAYVTLTDLATLEGRFDDALAANARARQIFERRADRRGQDECALQQARIALAGAQADAADTALRAIDAKTLNTEQRAAFELARAQRAALGDDNAGVTSALDAAAKAAADSHSGRLASAVELARAELALRQGDTAGARKRLDALRTPATRLADVPTRLQWLEDRLSAALQTERAAAPALYREALNLLKSAGRYRDAAVLHALGAQATGGAETAAARAAADTARKELLDAAPAAWRDALGASIARRSAEVGAHGR